MARRCDPKGFSDVAGDPFALPRDAAGFEHVGAPRNASVELFFGAFMPFLLSMVAMVTYTFAAYSSPVVPWVIVAMSANILALGNFPTKGRGPLGRLLVRDWFPFFLALFILGCGVGVGQLNREVIEHWVTTERFAQRDDVSPTDSAEAFMNSGILNFARGTKLDLDSAAGFQAWPDVYCAAPIVGKSGAGVPAAVAAYKGAPTPPPDVGAVAASTPVSFWAIGRNCCKARGGFDCGPVSDASVLSGIHAVAQQGDPNYMIAVKMAAAANDLVVARDPVFVHWEEGPRQRAKRSGIYAGIILAVSAVLSVVGCWFVLQLLSRVLGLSPPGWVPAVPQLPKRVRDARLPVPARS